MNNGATEIKAKNRLRIKTFVNIERIFANINTNLKTIQIVMLTNV